MSRLTAVVGGQYGSEAKGHVAARMAVEDLAADRQHVAVRVAGPNAGHTVYDAMGHRFAFRSLPVAAVVNPNAKLVVAAGSEVELEVLSHEVEWAESKGHRVRHRLRIDAQATLLTQAHKDAEVFAGLQSKIGSTQKGIGAARAERIMRRATLVGERAEDFEKLGKVTDTGRYLARKRDGGAHTLIEGTQGYGLGLHAGHYPKCTSSDARAIDFCAMAGVSPWAYDSFAAVVVLRVYPIRVAGDSGPLAGETTWGALGLPDEYTTVTKKVRRVGLWDPALARDAIEANGGPGQVRVVISMLDQMFPGLSGIDGAFNEHRQLIHETGAGAWLDHVSENLGASIVGIGTGPHTMVTL